MSRDSEARSGRPRDASIDERVLAVTRELLVQNGWHGLSLRLVAQQAGVGRASLTRRWPSKAALVLDAILGVTPDLAPFAGTDVDGWINWVVRGSHELYSRPEVKAAVPWLLLALQDNEDLRRSLWSNFSAPAVELFAEDVHAADAAAREKAELDARAVLAMAAGAALFMTTVAADDDSARLRGRIAALLRAGVGASTADRIND
ncbi:helix-turn-helix domain-containing protein [Mycobacterium paragordonae]|uniref:Helix-turn-helix domain-containing protein n=1 Tax=Mycobacterium paragordonae TaxID=1389713 RepID=A0A4R5WIB2_9MYCO|nr:MULTISPECIES: helix-turn-helix domain-containing protein [Mycobacterium]MDP7738929.1 helix-turn-helix domain-containing protein [Mycobacterium paragordonae]OBJ81495.1 TetR family transcriptional regulator [Mycobacterium gordonae]TDK86795.1 TetR/AcrR family transcriptional regulator [Mycobacterium paragordonae]TDK90225.1 TetR/AcrR family transcriptional regulator [Mycobacterium paragordonae]TDL03042.1 TetR/AcrR family transcriptional regulator [Mycobacterium paragordonae]